jgi:hypothetical protein
MRHLGLSVDRDQGGIFLMRMLFHPDALRLSHDLAQSLFALIPASE